VVIPALFDAVNVYTTLVVGVTVVEDLNTGPTPLSIDSEVAPLTTQRSVVVCPCESVCGEAEKDKIIGFV
jgi:CTP synthase (UTP-ammonia lyase)